MKTLKILFIVCLVFGAFIGSARAATLSQTNVYLSQGQSSTVYASNVSNSLYVSNNSNSSVASVYISGNNINIYANATGVTTATVCETNSSCNSIFINVNGNSSSNLSLSQTNLSLSVGQTSNITAYNYYGTLYISNNSNSSVATVSVNGNGVSIYGNSVGNTNVTICQNSNLSSCSTVYVNVAGSYVGGYGGNYGYNTTNTLGLSISSLTLATGNSITITSSDPAGMYISNNSNPTVVTTSYSSNLYSSLVPGCALNSQYSILTGQPCYGGATYGGSSYYYSSSIPGCVANYQYSILTGQRCYGSMSTNNNNNLSVTISALSIGSDTITLCPNSNSACSTIYVSVTN